MFSLIIPVYMNEASLEELVGALRDVAAHLECPLEVVFVVDGSPDRSAETLARLLPGQPFASKLIVHARNFGSFAAIRTGLAAGSGDLFGVIAADLQEPPSLVVDFARALREPGVDVAIGVRTGRKDPLPSRVFSAIFWAFYRRFVQPEVPPGGVDLFACTRAVRDELLRLRESNSTLVGLLFWVGFERRLVPYQRRARKHGRSAWTFARKVRYLIDSVYAFSDLPLRLLTAAGVLAMSVSIAVGTIVLAARLLGKIVVPGYTPIVLVTTFFGGLNALGFGVIGGYLWRAFENTKGRPHAIVRVRREFGPQSTGLPVATAPSGERSESVGQLTRAERDEPAS